MKASAILLTVVLLVACGGGTEPAASTRTAATTESAAPTAPKPPTPAEAAQIIGTSGTLGEFDFTKASVTIPMQKSTMNQPQLDAAKQLAKGGWIAFDGSGNVVLAKAQGDMRFLVRQNGYVDVVPVAKKEMGAVTAVRPMGATEAEAEFTFRWVPTEIGKAFTSGPIVDLCATPVNAKATLFWDGGAWSVLRVATR